ncbi:MAG: class I SAM-dependent methyltransferase [Methylococcaceae bacterium]|nr:class I SAM-dependent methyltransferase [Methylococcaceae bacterium]
MQRITEPELMTDKAQAEAYAAANFEQAHNLIVNAFDSNFPDMELKGNILDLGCGPGDITFRFANRYPLCRLLGIDGSDEMIRLANARKRREPDLIDRITFNKGVFPGALIPEGPYSAIISNSLLHHLHHPEVLWNMVKRYATSGTKILIVDLFRPQNNKDALKMVDTYSASEPDILQRDFYNSLLAALTLREIEQQLLDAELTELKIKKISDRHVLIFGEKS